MIPTMIYAEVQGNAIIRTLEHHENSRNEKLPELQEIINNIFVGLNTRLQRTEIAWRTRKIISALIVCALRSKHETRCKRDKDRTLEKSSKEIKDRDTKN
jgi:hypothetical protein